MASGEAFDSDWILRMGDAIPVGVLWRALEADGGTPGPACTAAFQSLRTQLDTTQAALEAVAPAAAGKEGGTADPTPEWLAPWLQTIARLGPWQHGLERAQGLQAALDRYLRAYAECARILIGSVRAGLDALEHRLQVAAQTPEQPPPESYRTLYDWWLTESEACYEETLASQQWAAAFGRLTNATTALLNRYQEQVDAGLRTLDLPNRDDFIDTQRRLVELERSQRRTARGDELTALREEVARLREEVNTLRADQSPGSRER
ncbi:poly(R)-hydroxyalkanoic acid synthase subunit PhaE [Halorhodospira halophila]|uniref:Poly(3-hydroxyalkanoate) polymerase subunit PhaE n=1 Tax=Halorhodospira halophila (strain DSM 244 / SL1) TaxID=349124 RepID=A1WZ55_HALHL|nr:poly(R)-hydroxyalkanoic acid synthase subunit PhaE [Halorhodospira halophila]ABM62967.1 conserved hypothetical protein [Halorhodospira halophila SL1]